VDLVGRDTELALVEQRLAERRIVTLTGPGGIGKTTLAEAVLEQCTGCWTEGTRTVDLTKVRTAEALQESLAGQLGYTSFAALIDSPGDHPVLVLVDNCEHVLDAAADAIDQLLSACEMPTILATSRTALELPGEAVVPIGPLELPLASGLDSPAVQLFLDRARDAGVQLEPSETVGELCRRLDGVPLAIELAAARTRSMTPEEILARLGQGLDVLDRPRRRGASRHRSLRATIDWSFELLPPSEQQLLASLTVFVGPFTAELAAAVVDPDGAGDGSVIDGLDALVGASMVAAESRGDTTWFRVLDTVRTFALERLDDDQRRELEARFVDHLLVRVLSVIERASGTWRPDALHELLDLYDNVSDAIRWCIRNDEAPDRALVFGAALWAVIHQAHTDEVGDLAERILERWSDSDHPMVADVVATAATCRYMGGDPDGAIAQAEAVLPRADRSSFAPATLRRALAQAHRARGDVAAAMQWFASTADHARRLGLQAMAVEADCARAQVLADVGRHDDALELVRSAREAAQEAGAELGVAWSRAIEGSILLRTDPASAARTLLDALSDAKRLGYDAGVGVSLRGLALAALCERDTATAAGRTAELLDDLLLRGSTYELRMVLDVASPILQAVGREQPARGAAATALSLPVVSITASVGHELFPLEAGEEAPMSIREAILLLRTELATVATAPAADGPGPSLDTGGAAGRFLRRADAFEISYRGSDVSLRASKGMVDLSRLLARPGREVHSLELAGAGVDEAASDEVIDATARTAYEDRIRELQGDIDEADRDNDIGRLERLQDELDALVEQLAAGLGLGGRHRRTSGTAERARSAVTQRIRATIRRIEEVHPALGKHLRASVRTGVFCSYEPEDDIVWET
jgi:predicted ATPase